MYKHFLKRLLDIVFSLLVFPLFGLILIPVAIAIKLDDGGPVFYKSARVGKGFQKFNMLKFRSMKVNAPDLLTEGISSVVVASLNSSLGARRIRPRINFW